MFNKLQALDGDYCRASRALMAAKRG